MSEKLKEQIETIRQSGEVNMCDWLAVQAIANRRGFHELVCFIEESPNNYYFYIVYGMEPK